MSLSCEKCNGLHIEQPCPERIKIKNRNYRVLPIAEFARRRKACYRKMNKDRDGAWDDLDKVSLFCPSVGMLPISSTPYIGRMFVERIDR